MIQILFFKKQVLNSTCVIQNNDEKNVFTKDILKTSRHVNLDCVFHTIQFQEKKVLLIII
jgi:hypothetical protein